MAEIDGGVYYSSSSRQARGDSWLASPSGGEEAEAMSICNHSYAVHSQHRPRSMGKQCPHSLLYDRLRSTNLSPEIEAAPFLPVDDHGACIFHSKEIAWKRQNDFTGKFLQLVQLLDEHD